MSRIEQAWPMDAFDAINILIPETRFEIRGTPGDQVVIEGNVDDRRDFQIDLVDRWLQIHQWERPRGTHLTLHLPRKKAWTVELSAWWGEIEVADVAARLQVKVGKGEIKVERCEGLFDLVSGQGNIELDNCTEKDMPAAPPRPVEVPPTTPAAPAGDSRNEFRSRKGARAPWDWGNWDEQDWTQWGMQLAEQATAWANHLSRFFTQLDWKPGQARVHIQTGKGDVHARDVDATNMTLWLGKGDIKMERGVAANLEAYAGHGDIECKSILPTGDWDIRTSHGNIRLALPANTQAKLDVATRRGDIRSEIPLVRVARPGPESRHGGRMVGTVGQAESKSYAPNDPRAHIRMRAGRWVMVDKEFHFGPATESGAAAQISLATVNGDIFIELESSRAPYSTRPIQPAKPAAEKAPSGATMTEENRTDTSPDEPASPSPATAGQSVATTSPSSVTASPSSATGDPSSVTGIVDANQPVAAAATEGSAATRGPATTEGAPAADPQLAILQALSQGQISVQEAERLLHDLG